MKNIRASVLEVFDIHRDPERFSAWPSVCRTRDNELLVVFSGDRLCHVDPFGKNMLVRSRDNGCTWSRPEKTDIWGLPPHLLMHSSGTLVSVYGHRRKPYSQRASFSLDHGKTWGHECILAAADHPLWNKPEDVRSSSAHRHDFFYQVPDLGYPCSVELPGGEILTVFYETMRPDTPAAVRGVRWRIHG